MRLRPDSGMKIALGDPLVTLDDVDVRLWGRALLRRISFTLREGESWALLGGNGAGKTTLLRLLRGEAWPHPGSRGRRTFHLDGSASESPIGARERIALVSAEAQDAYLRRGWAVPLEDVVRSGFTDGVWPGGRLDPAREAAVDGAIGLLGLSAVRRRTMVEVSTGEARRALLARALAPRPRALLLDEFVNGLDAASRSMVLDGGLRAGPGRRGHRPRHPPDRGGDPRGAPRRTPGGRVHRPLRRPGGGRGGVAEPPGPGPRASPPLRPAPHPSRSALRGPGRRPGGRPPGAPRPRLAHAPRRELGRPRAKRRRQVHLPAAAAGRGAPGPRGPDPAARPGAARGRP